MASRAERSRRQLTLEPLVQWRAGGRRRTLPGQLRRDLLWILACLGLTAAIVAADVLVGRSATLIGLLVVPPLLASTRAGAWTTALIGAVSVLLASLAGLWDNFLGTADHLVRVGAVSAGSGVAVWAASIRDRAFFERRQAEFVAETTTVLATSLDYKQTLRTVSELAVPALADIASIYLIEPDGSLRRIALAREDDAVHTPLAEQLAGVSGETVVEALKSGRSQLIEDVTVDIVEEPRAEAAVKEPKKLRLRSAMFVPLSARGRVLGAMGFATRSPGRRYRPDDLRFAEGIAARAAMAIENAQLYGDTIEAERAKEESLRNERIARAVAEAAERRAAFLAEASVILDASLNTDETLQAIARLTTPELADLCVIDLLEPDGSIRGVGVAAADADVATALRELRERFPLDPAGDHPVAQVLRIGEPAVLPAMSEEMLSAFATSSEHLRFMLKTKYHSAAVVPLQARGRTLGVISLLYLHPDASYGEEDLRFVGEIARRAALALDTARIYGERDETARILQQGLMPPALPTIEGADIAGGYWPATGELEVGGDFYDVFERGGDVFVAVGDVCGKGARAAALTGLARHTLRAASAWERRPAVTLSTLNQAVLEESIDDRFLTAVLCRLRCGSDGIDVTLACGGHPLPLLLRSDGTVEATGRLGTLIGVVENPTFRDEQVRLAPGEALVLYTDGITEVPVPGGRFGEERLAQVIAGCAGLEASAISERVERAALRQAGYARSDDAVVLVIRAT